MCEMNIELSNLTASDCDDSRLISVAEFSLTAMGIHRESELSISLVDEDEMSALHIRWMDEPGATDVLSFPMDEIKPHSSDQGPDGGRCCSMSRLCSAASSRGRSWIAGGVRVVNRSRNTSLAWV